METPCHGHCDEPNEPKYENGGSVSHVESDTYRSTAIATALPPPRQRAAMPRWTSRRIIS